MVLFAATSTLLLALRSSCAGSTFDAAATTTAADRSTSNNDRFLGELGSTAPPLPSFGDGFISDGSAVSIYSVEWSKAIDGCSSRTREPAVDVTCPVGTVLMQPSPEDCAQVDGRTVRCLTGTPPFKKTTVHVACYAPAGYAEDDLHLDVTFSEEVFQCDKLLRSATGFFLAQYFGGSVDVDGMLLAKCGEDGMKFIRSWGTGDDHSCETRFSCGGDSSFLGCLGSKQCEVLMPMFMISSDSFFSKKVFCPENFTTSLETGASCEYAVMCASKACIDGTCRASLIEEGGIGCTVDADCLTGRCSLNGDGVMSCCASATSAAFGVSGWDEVINQQVEPPTYCTDQVTGVPVICKVSSSSPPIKMRFEAEDAINLDSGGGCCSVTNDFNVLMNPLSKSVSLETDPATGRTAVAWFDRNDYLAFGPVDFASGKTYCATVLLRYSRGDNVAGGDLAGDDAMVLIKLDSPDGQLVAEFNPVVTGGWNVYIDGKSFALISGVEGEHIIYVEGRRARGVMNLDWIDIILSESTSDAGMEDSTRSKAAAANLLEQDAPPSSGPSSFQTMGRTNTMDNSSNEESSTSPGLSEDAMSEVPRDSAGRRSGQTVSVLLIIIVVGSLFGISQFDLVLVHI